jgi:serine/threonine-protein kinase
MELDPGSLGRGSTLGDYRMLDKLGQGGFGTVWWARHELLLRDAAIKVISKDRLTDAGNHRRLLEHFKREARATAKLKSHHSVEIYEFGITDDGGFYYAMELLRGMDLHTLITDHGPIPAERVVAILDQVCIALHEAHSAGLVHRDIKPANIYLCASPNDDFVKVLDFGLMAVESREGSSAPAKNRQGESIRAMLSRASGACGTPGFIAPEVIAGAEIDGRSDIYALGSVAYWLLTGDILFDNTNTYDVIKDHLSKPPPPLPDHVVAPVELRDLVHECLAKIPDDRPKSMASLCQRLRAIRCEHPWTRERAEAWW